MTGYNTDYSKTFNALVILFRPYEQSLTVVVRQEDSYCLYTGNPKDTKSVLFAAVQVMKEGVVLSLYQPLDELLSRYKIPERVLRFKTGDNRFTFIKFPYDLRNDLKQLFSRLYAIYYLEKMP